MLNTQELHEENPISTQSKFAELGQIDVEAGSQFALEISVDSLERPDRLLMPQSSKNSLMRVH